MVKNCDCTDKPKDRKKRYNCRKRGKCRIPLLKPTPSEVAHRKSEREQFKLAAARATRGRQLRAKLKEIETSRPKRRPRDPREISQPQLRIPPDVLEYTDPDSLRKGKRSAVVWGSHRASFIYPTAAERVILNDLAY